MQNTHSAVVNRTVLDVTAVELTLGCHDVYAVDAARRPPVLVVCGFWGSLGQQACCCPVLSTCMMLLRPNHTAGMLGRKLATPDLKHTACSNVLPMSRFSASVATTLSPLLMYTSLAAGPLVASVLCALCFCTLWKVLLVLMPELTGKNLCLAHATTSLSSWEAARWLG
jgi:hypothetical protein